MRLPFFKPKPAQQSNKEYIFALEIGHSFVKSAIWTVKNGQPEITSTSDPVEWDDRSEESLIDSADKSLSQTTQLAESSGSQISPSKVILGVTSDWVSDEKIAPKYRKMLKTVSQKLSLEAVGFVVTAEAIAQYLRSTEKIPATAILIGVSTNFLEITLAKQGKILSVEEVVRSNQPALDVVEGLSRCKHLTDTLPSRILLYDSNHDLHPVQQALLAHPWQSPQTKLSFLHFPKVEILPPHFSIHAVALSGGSEVAQAIGLLDSDAVEDHPEEVAGEPEVVLTEPITTVPTLVDLGFIAEADIATHAAGILDRESVEEESPVIHTPTIHHSVTAHKPHIHIARPRFHLKKTGLAFAVLAVLLLVSGGLAAAYWYLPKADVILVLKTEKLNQLFDVRAGVNINNVDASSASLPAQLKQAEISDTLSIPATGTKLVGDKATGKVVIVNGTPVAKKFPSGTLLTTPNGIKFLTTEEVTVASASGSADPNSYQPGKVTVGVTASDIGTDGNISAGTQFKVATYSSLDYVAKNDDAISGGTSKSVKAVSKADYSTLRSKLQDQVKEKAKSELLNQISDSEQFLDATLRVVVASEEFSHKIDESADEVSLKLTAKAEGLTISKTELNDLVMAKIQPSIPEKYRPSGAINPEVTLKTTDKSQASLSVKVSADLIPAITTDDLPDQLVGKSVSVATDTLSALPGVGEVQINLTPSFSYPGKSLPRIAKNITVQTR